MTKDNLRCIIGYNQKDIGGIMLFKYNDENFGRETEKLLFQKGYVTLKDLDDILNHIKEKK